MQRKILSVLLVLSALVFLSSTATAIDTEIHSYDNQMIEAAKIAESNARARSHRLCWRAVRDAMVEAAVLDERPTTKYAKQAGDELEEKYGFKKIDISDPFAAPVGSVLVYGGRGAGHVEIRMVDGFVSDHVSSHPSRRPLIGVYVRSIGPFAWAFRGHSRRLRI